MNLKSLETFIKQVKKITWPWQYKNKIKEYEARIHELKAAGWYATNGWYNAIKFLNCEQYKATRKEYRWEKVYSVFAKDKNIDGPRKNLLDF